MKCCREVCRGTEQDTNTKVKGKRRRVCVHVCVRGINIILAKGNNSSGSITS